MKNPFRRGNRFFDSDAADESRDDYVRDDMFLDDEDDESEEIFAFIDRDDEEADESGEHPDYDDINCVDEDFEEADIKTGHVPKKETFTDSKETSLFEEDDDEDDIFGRYHGEADDYDEDEVTFDEPDMEASDIGDKDKGPGQKGGGFGFFRNRKIIFGIVAAAIVVLIVSIVALGGRHGSEEEAEEEIQIVTMEIDDVTHLSFPVLSLDGSNGSLSVDDFRNILQILYDEGYVLIDLGKLYETTEEGDFVLKNTIMFPEGKKPLLISQRDVSYAFEVPKNTADKLVLDGDDIKAQMTGADGTVSYGDYDMIPILESFIKLNPDFSYEDARGIIGVTGYRGVLGYATTAYLADPAQNPYGAFDTAAESAAAAPVIEWLRAKGWRFAANGFGQYMSYGSELSIMQGDAGNWISQVSNVVGATDIILLPGGADIASWKGYSETNQKYVTLRDQGFKFFFAENKDTPYMIQLAAGYFRQLIYDIDTYSDIFGALGIENTQTPAAPEAAEAPAEGQPEVQTSDQSAEQSSEQQTGGEQAPADQEQTENADAAVSEQTN